MNPLDDWEDDVPDDELQYHELVDKYHGWGLVYAAGGCRTDEDIEGYIRAAQLSGRRADEARILLKRRISFLAKREAEAQRTVFSLVTVDGEEHLVRGTTNTHGVVGQMRLVQFGLMSAGHSVEEIEEVDQTAINDVDKANALTWKELAAKYDCERWAQ